MEEEKNLTQILAVSELGASDSYNDTTVSSPFRRDSDPSFRCYIAEDRGFYDWGAGKSYSPVGLIMELKEISFREASEYIKINYGVSISSKSENSDSGIDSKLKILYHFGTGKDWGNMEETISNYFSGDKTLIDKKLMGINSFNL